MNVHAGESHDLSDLCCKAGVELELMFKPENQKYKYVMMQPLKLGHTH